MIYKYLKFTPLGYAQESKVFIQKDYFLYIAKIFFNFL